eukprot:748051-Hanusia_phi.AAC.4
MTRTVIMHRVPRPRRPKKQRGQPLRLPYRIDCCVRLQSRGGRHAMIPDALAAAAAGCSLGLITGWQPQRPGPGHCDATARDRTSTGPGPVPECFWQEV